MNLEQLIKANQGLYYLKDAMEKNSCLTELVEKIIRGYDGIECFGNCRETDADSSILAREAYEYHSNTWYRYESKFYVLDNQKLVELASGSVANAILQQGFSQENLPEYVVMWHMCDDREALVKYNDVIAYKLKDAKRKLLSFSNDKKKHDFISRERAHHAGELHGTVHIELIPSDDWEYCVTPRIVVQKRAKDKDIYPNCWDIYGGHVDDSLDLKDPMNANKEFIKSAIRELNEELGIDVNPKSLGYIGCERTSEVIELPNRTIKNEEINEIFAYRLTHSEFGRMKPTEEVQEIKLVRIDELLKENPDLIAGALKKTLDRRTKAGALLRGFYQIGDRDPELEKMLETII